MHHFNPIEAKKRVRYYLDFDGTLTKIAGELLANNADYRFLENLSTESSMLSSNDCVSVFKTKPELGLTKESFEFLKKNIENNNEIVIVSRNHRKYISMMLLAAGLDSKLLSKIVIYDSKSLNTVGGDKGSIVEKHEHTWPLIDEIMIADDNAADACSMFAVINKYQYKHASCISCSSGQFNWELICSSERDDITLSDSNAWLIREGSSHSTFTAVFHMSTEAVKKRLSLTELKDVLVNKEIKIFKDGTSHVIKLANTLQLTNSSLFDIVNSLTSLSNVISSSASAVSAASSNTVITSTSSVSAFNAAHSTSLGSIHSSHSVAQPSLTKLLITSSSVINGYLDPKIDPEDMIHYMKENKTPPVVMYPTNEQGQFLSTIESPENKNNKAICYAISFLTLDDQVKTLKFKTKERDPQKINAELCKKLKMPIVITMAGGHPKNDVFTELLKQNEPEKKVCGLVHIHRDKTVRPEERIFAVNHATGTLIVSTQTPSEEAKEGLCQFATRGNTGCEIERLLSKASAPFQDKWVIITGHGSAGDNTISGGYRSLFSPREEEVACDEKEYTEILKQAGIKKGDTINLLLYVCYSARSTQSDKSLAEKLAHHLASEGITCNIIASKSAVQRFAGYNPNAGEIDGACMSYNVIGGSSDIVVVTGTPGKQPTIEIKEGLYPNGFYITPNGLGGPEVKQTLVNANAYEQAIRQSLNG